MILFLKNKIVLATPAPFFIPQTTTSRRKKIKVASRSLTNPRSSFQEKTAIAVINRLHSSANLPCTPANSILTILMWSPIKAQKMRKRATAKLVALQSLTTLPEEHQYVESQLVLVRSHHMTRHWMLPISLFLTSVMLKYRWPAVLRNL